MPNNNPNYDAVEDPRIGGLSAWLVQEGILGSPQIDMLEAYCQKLVALGAPLIRAHVTMNALHPVYGGVGFDWLNSAGSVRHEYEHANQSGDVWRVSPFYYMLSHGLSNYRERLCETNDPSRFALLNEMKAVGATDYFAAAVAFSGWEEGTPVALEDGIEGVMMSWMSHAAEGFSEQDIGLIRATFPVLCLALKSGSNRKMAEDLLGVYLGRDAGQRVLSGEIQRGSSHWIDAVICYFDLADFTSMSQQIEGEALLALLNDYFGTVVEQIEANGGNVLKFMGDGLLAIFDRHHLSDAPQRALRMTEALEHEMANCSQARAANGLPTLEYTMAVHAGPVLYGNMGGDERLDFTVIGPEVNLAARISAMHRSLGQRIVISEAVARDVSYTEFGLISLGRYMLRGVDQPQELFTIFRD
ncbi:adenylate/guanylate cyclase domain-containing protein [Sulfitobacter sp.]|uniref:adenylate/guanylate cyclase domain-containing protein n=1 Tax=Sulfitobacter sp. TaxID=1903071 RepID=UPI003001D51D